MGDNPNKQFEIDKIFSAEHFRKVGHDMVDMIADHLDRVHNDPNYQTIPHVDPAEQLKYWQEDFEKVEPIQDTFQHIFDRSIKLHNPRYIGHQVATIAPITSVAGMMVDILNNGTGVYEMGMAANAIEHVLINFMNQQIGYPSEAGGIFTSGGTLANLTALLTARKVKAPNNVWTEGSSDKLALMVSEASHYCIDRAARIMGLGDQGIIKVPTDDQYRMRTDMLPDLYAKAKADGLTVFAIVGCSCTTSTGSFDDLEAIGAFAQKENIWFHVDGAHGGGIAMSNKYKHYIKGLEQSDSITIDYHKMMLTPSLVTSVLYKKALDSYKTFAQKAEYLWESSDSNEWYNSGKRTFECTKNMMCVQVYSILKAHGKETFIRNNEHLFDAARLLAKLIKERNNFELLIEPQANIVNFRYTHSNIQDLNEYTDKIRTQLIKEGLFYIVSVMVDGQKYLRCSVMNPITEEKHFLGLLDSLERIGKELI